MNWVLNNTNLIAANTWWHVLQAVPAVLLSFVIALPIAKVADRWAPVRSTVSALSGLLYAIPSLPLFIVLPLIFGTGLRSPLNTAIALTLYGLALMIPGAISALRTVDRSVLESAKAQGFTAAGRFFGVELPLAGPALVATLRVVAVSTVALVTVGGVLGVPSLGMLFTDGIKRGLVAEIATGVVLTAVIALSMDALIVALGKLLMPWTRKGVRR